MKIANFRISLIATSVALAFGLSTAGAAEKPPKIDSAAEMIEHDDSVFAPGPQYDDQVYDAEGQKAIYGGKTEVVAPRPLLELGRPQYQAGPLSKSYNIIGERNLVAPAVAVYGDFRTALARNDNGEKDLAQIAARLNLDVDVKLTATERIHAFLRPLDRDGQFSRIELSGDKSADEDVLQLDGNLETLFFEGDLGAIVNGASDTPSTWDLPFAVGLMPLLFQNGVWLEDAFTGLAFTLAAKNSPKLDISNYDITFFAGFDKVSNQGILDADGNVADEDVNVYGIATFLETRGGYAEIDYAFIDGQDEFDDLDHHNISAAFTKRIGKTLSTSIRVMSTFGQDPDNGVETAGGTLLLWENSLITTKPSTLIPYFNLFAGFDRPQSVARDNGGVLKNTGINFETDGLTGFPLLDDSAQDTWGGAFGIQYLFALNRQVVVEVATVQLMDEDEPLGQAQGDQWALGLRFQQPVSKSVIFRFDAMRGWRDNEEDIHGVRFEFRRKF